MLLFFKPHDIIVLQTLTLLTTTFDEVGKTSSGLRSISKQENETIIMQFQIHVNGSKFPQCILYPLIFLQVNTKIHGKYWTNVAQHRSPGLA